MTKCITCGDELHPERARKYDYCLKPECQAKNLKGLTMVAVGSTSRPNSTCCWTRTPRPSWPRASTTTSGAAPSARPGRPRPAADRAPGGARPGPNGPGQLRPGRGRAGEHYPSQRCPGEGQPGEHHPGRTSRASAAGHGVAAPAGGPVQPAGPAAGRDRRQARAEPVRRHPDHPGRAEPREELRTQSASVGELGPYPQQPDRPPVGEPLQRLERRLPDGVPVRRRRRAATANDSR